MTASDIQLLSRKQWEGFQLPFSYTSEQYYDLRIQPNDGGWTVTLVRTPFETPFHKTDEGYDRLYQEWLGDGAQAYGVFDGETLAAVIELCPEEWDNRLMVTELWVEPGHRRQGLGRLLMDFAKAEGHRQKRRALVLETQSCNASAVAFYLAQGLDLFGFDRCAYRNDDVSRREARLNLGCLLEEGVENRA